LPLPVLTLEQRIQRWVQLDNQLKQLNDQVRALRESRNDVESGILTHVADHNLSHATVRIKDGGTLRFAFNAKHPPAITLAFLGEALAECCPPQQAADIMKHIRAKRDAAAKLVSEIRRTHTTASF
jgi:DNA-binding FrmR family transcriptional regulator